MSRSAAGSRPPARLPATPDSDLFPPHKPHRRRRIKSRAFSATSQRKGGSSDPFPPRKLDSAESGARADGEAAPSVSARRLAAGMMHLMPPAAGGGGGSDGRAPVGFEPGACHLHVCNTRSRGLHSGTRKEFGGLDGVRNPENGGLQKFDTTTVLTIPVLERATKWDPGYMKASTYQFSNRPNVVSGQQAAAAAAATSISVLQTELQQARTHIDELEDKRRSTKRKIHNFLRKLAEEKSSWRRREHDRIQAIIDGTKDDLSRERKNRQRIEIVNSKLVNELAEAKLSAKRYLQDYEKERKSRELMEEVCDELAKENGEDRAEVEILKRESMEMREEVEEERKMLQMAEVWREERVQMKLIDAKVTLEEKFSQLGKLKADLDLFLRARSSTSSDPLELREAELLRDAAESVNLQDIKEFSYQPPPDTDDIFSIFEEFQPKEDTDEREIDPCYGYSPVSSASKIYAVSPATDIFLEKPTKKYDNGLFDRNDDLEDDSGWETVSHVEDEGSIDSPAGSEPSVNGMRKQSNASVSKMDWDDIGDNHELTSEIIEVCSVTSMQSSKKSSYMSRIWRSSYLTNGEFYKDIPFEMTNGSLSNGKTSKGIVSPDRRSGEAGLSPTGIGQWSSPDSVNPHVTRGMKGCIDWPRGMQKHSLKSKHFEARTEHQRLQLRHALKQKI